MAIVLIPGIKGSELVDTYPLAWPTRWSLEDMVVGDIGENPLDLALLEGRYDAHDAHRLQASRPLRYAYGEMVGKLRAWRAPESLYVFTYDWRRPIEQAAARLVEFCAEIEGRLKSLGRSEPLHFISHSMGGLVLRSALGLRNARDPFAGVGRVVFIAPPFRGSVGAVKMLVAGEKDGWFGTDEDYRRIARSFPSVYALTPGYAGAAVDEQGAEVDLFDARNWQANVRDGGEFRPEFLAGAEALLRGRRARHGGSSPAPLLPDAALAANAERVLVLQSAGVATPRQLPVQVRNARNPNWCDFAGVSSDLQGDGRVHLASSAVPGVTLAAYAGAADHGRVCRDSRIINTVSLFLEGKKALRMTPRGPDDSATRRGRRYFAPWDGDAGDFDDYIA